MPNANNWENNMINTNDPDFILNQNANAPNPNFNMNTDTLGALLSALRLKSAIANQQPQDQSTSGFLSLLQTFGPMLAKNKMGNALAQNGGGAGGGFGTGDGFTGGYGDGSFNV